ncbi:MAG: hypothetical protein RR365_14800 [Bacteroides sp.]
MYKFIALMPEIHGGRELGEFNTLKEAFDCGFTNGCNDETCKCNSKGFNVKVVFEDGQSSFVQVVGSEENPRCVAPHTDENGNFGYEYVGNI